MLGEYHYLLALVSVADMLDTPSFEFVLFRLPNLCLQLWQIFLKDVDVEEAASWKRNWAIAGWWNWKAMHPQDIAKWVTRVRL